jgi:rare lipoprotein A
VIARISIVALLLAGCASGPPPRPSPPDPTPAVYGNRPTLMMLRGKASYYHDSLAGNLTANGEAYDPNRMTAASRDLPFGTVLRVVRRDTRRWILVRVNDRGPFGDERRILDLSREAARRLDMLRRGVADIHVDVLEWGPPRRGRRR